MKRMERLDVDLQENLHRTTVRPLARLDKNYLTGLQTNGTKTEDVSWLSGKVLWYETL